MSIGLLEEANDLLRSAHAIAQREGAYTNWPAFRARLEEVLVRQSQLLNGTVFLDAAVATPRTFRLPPREVKLKCPEGEPE